MKKHIEKFKSLEKGQKIKLIIVIILLVIILYMLSGFLGSSSNSNNSTPTTVNTSAKPLSVSPVKPLESVIQKRSIAKPDTVLNNLNDKQMAYLKAVNELQMLQLKQQIAQTKQQIAQAELQAAQSNKQLQALTAPPPPPLLTNNISSDTPIQQAPTTNQYQLQYVANEGGKWQVIISNNGALINATMGSTLPDGSVVTHISGTSVTLTRNGENNILTIAPSF